MLLGGALGVALTLLVVGGHSVLQRDRDALLDGFAANREQGIVEAARGLTADVSDIGEDLQLASSLLKSSKEGAERALHAIATIKREYLVMYARSDGETTKVTAADAPAGVAALADATLLEMLDEADRVAGLQVSKALADANSPARWYRVYSARSKHGPTVAVAVDTSILLSRMKLQRDPMTRVLILDGELVPAGVSDPMLAAHVRAQPAQFEGLLATVATGSRAIATVEEDLARRIGLPETAAVAIGVPLHVDRGPPWTLMVVSSTQTLNQQERTIVTRVVAGGILVLLLLVSAAAYVLHNAYRARTLRERIKHAERLAQLTDKLMASEKLATAGQLAAGIAHEIGTPLNVARGRVELSLSHLGAEHGEADNQRVVIDQIDRVTRLIQQLLDYVRPRPAAMQDVPVAPALQAVVTLLAPQAAKRHVKLHVETSGTPVLHLDPDQLQQLVVNLTLNAIDACERGGNVWLRAKGERAVVLEIVDDGQGIPPELHKQVFDPFFTTKKRGQGTGLGLWVVAQLVRAQAGEIDLTSEVGRGTTVRVAWPA